MLNQTLWDENKLSSVAQPETGSGEGKREKQGGMRATRASVSCYGPPHSSFQHWASNHLFPSASLVRLVNWKKWGHWVSDCI